MCLICRNSETDFSTVQFRGNKLTPKSQLQRNSSSRLSSTSTLIILSKVPVWKIHLLESKVDYLNYIESFIKTVFSCTYHFITFLSSSFMSFGFQSDENCSNIVFKNIIKVVKKFNIHLRHSMDGTSSVLS